MPTLDAITEPQKSESRAGTRLNDRENTFSADRNPHGNLSALLSRLERVRPAGKGHTARCPAHKDRTASLSIRATDDHTILLKCFAGCGAAEVVGALGLTLGDLFPTKPRDCSPAGRAQMRQFAKEAQWGAALGVLGFEAGVLQMAGGDMLTGQHCPENQERIALAVERIGDARQVLR